ncbi:MAG: hypothetical protein JKX94_13095, partial [Sneathiella sp.]|nr:hypothetical protein [Sneathiella sp.]
MALVINEFFFDNSGADIYEFIELKGDPNTDYSGYTVVYIEGDNGSTLGRVNIAVELGPDAITDANGILNIEFTPGELQNGTGTIMLVNGPVTEAYADVDQDGTLDVAWDIVDSVAVDEGGTDIVYSSTVVDARGGASLDPETGEWVANDYTGVGLPGSSEVGPVGNDEVASTPGAVNDSPVGEDEEPPFEPAPPEDLTAIYDIQGEGHTSTFNGLDVISVGIVTAVDSNGFYFQDATGDGNARTSDGVFVYTGSAPDVVVGDNVQVTGNVGEYQP